MLQFIAWKEKIEEDMLKICESEIELAHDAYSDTLEFLDKLFTVGRIHRPSRRGAVTDNTGGSLDPFFPENVGKNGHYLAILPNVLEELINQIGPLISAHWCHICWY